MSDTPNPFVRGMLYNKERAQKDFEEIRGVPYSQTKEEFDEFFKEIDRKLHNEGLLRPNQPPIAIRATSI